MSAKQKLNIWLTQATEPLPTICKMRTSLYADKLIERGHDVIWFATAFDHFSKKWVFKIEDYNMNAKLKTLDYMSPKEYLLKRYNIFIQSIVT